MVRTATHKLLRRNGHGNDELFDLVNDPEERRNIIGQADQAGRVEALDRELNDFFAAHEVPGHSGLLAAEKEKFFNANEIWRWENQKLCFPGWPSNAATEARLGVQE
jgi:hypothetical protein